MGHHYKIYSASTATGAALSSVKIVKKGKIKCIHFDMALTGGAGVGRQTIEISKQNSTSLQINDTPPTVIASASVDVGNALTTGRNVTLPCDIDVDVGDTIYLNQIQAGTAAAAAIVNVYLYT